MSPCDRIMPGEKRLTESHRSVHQKKYDVASFTAMLKAWYAFRIEYLVALFFVKISILAFYRRLSPARWFQLAIKIMAGFVTAFTLSLVLVTVRALRRTHSQTRMFLLFYADAVRKTWKGLCVSQRPKARVGTHVP